MSDYAAVHMLLRRRILALSRSWSRRLRQDAKLMERAGEVMDELVADMNVVRDDLRHEQARSTALERELAQAWEAAGFERNGFDKLAAVHDSLGTVKDLLKALDLVGDGIGGDVGFAVSAVANEAAMTADNAWCEAGTMIEMRKAAMP